VVEFEEDDIEGEGDYGGNCEDPEVLKDVYPLPGDDSQHDKGYYYACCQAANG